MKQAVVLLVVALAVMGSAKPYESNRKPVIAPNQYPFYGPNFLYGTDRLSEDFLNRLFAKRPEDYSSVDVPFVRVPGDRLTDVDERLWQLLKPQEKPIEVDLPKPKEEADIETPDVLKEIPVEKEEGINNENLIEKEQEKPQQPEQQPNEDDKERQQQKPDPEPPKEDEQDKEQEHQKPDQSPKKDDKDKDHKQQKPDQPPKEDDKRKEMQPNKGNRPGGRKPFGDLDRRPGKQLPGGDRVKPELPSRLQPELPPPARRQPDAPLVQINVNVGSPLL